MLKIKNLSAKYDVVQVLWDISIQVAEGEMIALVGANGSGKTTLLKVISGLMRPLSGTILFMNKRIDFPPHYLVRELGLVHIPEDRKLFPNMTVLENLELGSYTRNAKKQRKITMENVFSIFPRLRERQKQLAGTLSGGEQRMLGIGRGLMALPKLLMLDEPCLGLAPLVITEIFSVIKEINKTGCTILLVEQNVLQSLQLSSYAYVLERGKIVQHGLSTEILGDERIKKAYMGL